MTTLAAANSQYTAKGGLPFAVGAYLLWGLLPLYLHQVKGVPPLQMVCWRSLTSVPVCLGLLALRGRLGELVAVLANRRLMGMLLASSLMIGSNWLLYFSAVQAGHIFATSLGFYINPLVNVLLGTAFLGEKLSRAQWLAVWLAGSGVGLLLVLHGGHDALTMLAIAFSLALTFAAYGLIRKFTDVSSLTALTVEVLVLMLPAAGLLLFASFSPAGLSLGSDALSTRLMALSGLITAFPLIMFGVAAQRMEYSTLGFIQYFSPTMVFLTGIFYFHEALQPAQLACFMLIWLAIAVYSWDMLARRRA